MCSCARKVIVKRHSVVDAKRISPPADETFLSVPDVRISLSSTICIAPEHLSPKAKHDSRSYFAFETGCDAPLDPTSSADRLGDSP